MLQEFITFDNMTLVLRCVSTSAGAKVPIRYRLTELMRSWEQQQEEPPGSRTFRRMAQLVDLSPDTLNRIANQKVTRIDHETIEKLCTFFGCELYDLMVLE